jgi:hypothetical protein
MKRAAFPLLSLALGLVFLGVLRRPASSTTEVHRARHNGVSSGTIARAIAGVVAAPRKDDDDRAATKQRLRDGEAGTYIGDILRERDSSLARWPDREENPLTVWIQPRSSVGDFNAEYVAKVRSAFEEWDALELPVRFVFVADSADAEVHVNWVDHFSEPISGRTRWARDDDWIITDANIVLAIHHNQGDQLDYQAMRAMAMHEIGHLLGLDHTTDNMSIMAPKVRVRELSDADRATVRLLYALPAGPLAGR